MQKLAKEIELDVVPENHVFYNWNYLILAPYINIDVCALNDCRYLV